ncbi:ABC transporter permease [Peptostreptococcus equinus]|uniref:ABC transporter permease n=1 Tax=Peptostreptococcus equinus TaxID=3003601 RepID=A0ABY7JS42_9FIRM|nr:ABC transporter permease [Peptostreptococcus sp. CBA3647]WAW14512.1 ABC transporter permease [Peptostreptococcus sp. CBA3647]
MKELIQYYQVNGAIVLEQFFTHFLISIYGVLFACIVAIPLGMYISKSRKLSAVTIGIANIIQTIPSLALLSLLMVAMGLGTNTVVATVFLYSLLPILKNTCTGLNNVNKNLLDVAKGMGMTKSQVMMKVKMPLALSVIMGGIRNALVLAVGIATIGTFIGAGGLGDIISRGISVSNGSAIIWAGTIPTALMAVIFDLVLAGLEKKFTNYSS